MDVVTLQWPLEEERRRALADAGVPRLLIVDDRQPPPVVRSMLEDWVRANAPEIDRSARADALRRRCRTERPDPVIDSDGLLRVEGGSWVALPPVEASLAGTLLAAFGAVVAREDLAASAWPDGVARNVLDVRILRLRRRLDDLGLAIRTVRSRGYLMEWI